jgi:predicted O-methyltransferase YrrM
MDYLEHGDWSFEYIKSVLGDKAIDKAHPIHPWQVHCEFLALLKKYVDLQPKNVLEIGVYEGGTLWYWLNYAVPGAKIWGIDHGEGNIPLWNSWNTVPGVEFHFCKGDSQDPTTYEQISSEKFDFIFIDAEHDYASVKRDFEIYSPLLNEGGILAFHDISNTMIEIVTVYVLWKELVDSGKYKTESIECPDVDPIHRHGIGVIYWNS